MVDPLAVRIPLISDKGMEVGALLLGLPAGRGSADSLLDLRSRPDQDLTLEPFQLLEGQEYTYTIVDGGALPGPYALEPAELFSADGDSAGHGRFRTELNTGRLLFSVEASSGTVGRAAAEVRSRKLSYVSDYRQMLEDVASVMAALVLNRFSPSQQRLRSDGSRDAQTLYQRFAFLSHLMAGEPFEAAIGQILHRPHHTFEAHAEQVRPGRGVPASSAAGRQIARPGPRTPWDGPNDDVSSLPVRLWYDRWEESTDTRENRFVKYVLVTFHDFVAEVERALKAERLAAPIQRGLKEVAGVRLRLEEILAAPLFADIGDLAEIPMDSQVLQRRGGYREFLLAFLQFETAAAVTWDGGENVYGAGQRDVAVLYEFWVFLQIAGIVAELVRVPLDYEDLLQERADGMGVTLRQGRTSVVRGNLTRLNRRLGLELFFNKTFSSRDRARGSWTRPMRPDVSLHIMIEQGDDVWVHFDAKYRVETIGTLFGVPTATDEDEADELAREKTADRRQESKRVDLLKMHAYRDAVKRSAGAYVIYPGTEKELNQQYHEILPGLGAFALRPGEGGAAVGISELRNFISDVLNHVALQVSQHERTRYWVAKANERKEVVPRDVPAVAFLRQPPADTKVVLGYVRDKAQMKWVVEQKRYNTRAFERRGALQAEEHILQGEYVLLYSKDFQPHPPLWRVAGPPELWFQQRMEQTGYGGGLRPVGPAYFCMPVEPVAIEGDFSSEFWRRVLLRAREDVSGEEYGRPVLVTWTDMARMGLRVEGRT
jgi:predicted component of viral defense system (DUF524 family)